MPKIHERRLEEYRTVNIVGAALDLSTPRVLLHFQSLDPRCLEYTVVPSHFPGIYTAIVEKPTVVLEL